MLTSYLRCCAFGDQYSPSPELAVVEVLYRVVDGVQRVGRSVQIDLALGGQHHEFGQIVVGTDQVAGDVALGRDDVYCRDLHHAAVADDVVGTTGSGHHPGVILRSALAHVIEDDLGAVTVRHLKDGVHVAVAHLHRLVRAPLLGELQRLLRGVGDDNLRRGQRSEALDAYVPEPPGPDDQGLRTRVEERDGLPNSVVSGEARVRKGSYVFRLQDGIQLHYRAGVGLQEVGEATVAGETRELTVLAVHVISGAASPAQAAGHERVADHRVSDLDVGHRRADLLDPA